MHDSPNISKDPDKFIPSREFLESIYSQDVFWPTIPRWKTSVRIPEPNFEKKIPTLRGKIARMIRSLVY